MGDFSRLEPRLPRGCRASPTEGAAALIPRPLPALGHWGSCDRCGIPAPHGRCRAWGGGGDGEGRRGGGAVARGGAAGSERSAVGAAGRARLCGFSSRGACCCLLPAAASRQVPRGRRPEGCGARAAPRPLALHAHRWTRASPRARTPESLPVCPGPRAKTPGAERR